MLKEGAKNHVAREQLKQQLYLMVFTNIEVNISVPESNCDHQDVSLQLSVH